MLSPKKHIDRNLLKGIDENRIMNAIAMLTAGSA